MNLLIPDDFKSLYGPSEDGEIMYIASAKPSVRTGLAMTTNVALRNMIGLERRITRQQWMSFYDACADWGKHMHHDLEFDRKNPKQARRKDKVEKIKAGLLPKDI